MLHGEQYPFIRVQQRPCPKGTVNFLSVLFFFFFFLRSSLPSSFSPVFLGFLASFTPPFPGLGWDQAAFLMRAEASAWALLSMQLHEPRNPPSIPSMSCCCQLSEITEKKNKAPSQLAQVIIGCYYSVGAGLGGAWRMSSLPARSETPRRGRSDTVPFLPAHILPSLPAHIHKQKALSATARDAEPSKHSIWMWL